MSNKTTDELINELKNSESIDTFLTENFGELTEKALAEELNRLLLQKGLKKSDVINKSCLNEVYAYQIFKGTKAPSRNKILALCIAMKLSIDETRHVLILADAGELYPRNERDCIIMFALEHNMSVMDCNALLVDKNIEIL